MDTEGRLWLLRHGETEWSAAGRHTGLTDIALTERGERMAAAAGERLAPHLATDAWVITSPLRRAVRTAHLAGLEASGTDARIAERHYGPVEGLSTADVRTGAADPAWDVWDDDLHPGPPTTPPPGAYVGAGESLEEVADRCDDLLDLLRRRIQDGGQVVLVAHSHLHRILAARWCGLAPVAGRHLVLGPAGIGALGYERSTPAILAWNT